MDRRARHRPFVPALQDDAPETFYADVEQGLKRAPMALRISPYLLSLIDWENPWQDPIRTQFLPLASQQLADHPELRRPFYHVPHSEGIAGTAAQFALHVNDLMNRNRRFAVPKALARRTAA